MTETDNTKPTFPAAPVMPSTRSPESTPEEITALDALHFGWNHPVMRAVDRELSFMGGLTYEPGARERAGLRAWVTATDERIGHVVYATEADPQGFAFVAREVTALDDNALLARYQERRRETATGRYLVREVSQMAASERAAMLKGYEAAAERYADAPEHEEGARYRQAAEGLRDGRGYVLWDRINHRYNVAQWRGLPEEIAPQCDRLNGMHERHFAANLWR
ncbi:hypothetical protein ACFV42_46555 [Streptomyces solisilvae]|uniref:hypothetical protein n=1 Tax=Streptomyces malaysiensis TaxID=92644 RepID=UPI0036CA5F91